MDVQLFIYKYVYFQNNCINIIHEANVKDTAVFSVTPSPLNMYVIKVNIIIPDTNDKNLNNDTSNLSDVAENELTKTEVSQLEKIKDNKDKLGNKTSNI